MAKTLAQVWNESNEARVNAYKALSRIKDELNASIKGMLSANDVLGEVSTVGAQDNPSLLNIQVDINLPHKDGLSFGASYKKYSESYRFTVKYMGEEHYVLMRGDDELGNFKEVSGMSESIRSAIEQDLYRWGQL